VDNAVSAFLKSEALLPVFFVQVSYGLNHPEFTQQRRCSPGGLKKLVNEIDFDRLVRLELTALSEPLDPR